jgi:hypothetical protein
MQCLKEHGNDAEGCREVAKAYLKCRMERWVGALSAPHTMCLPTSCAAHGCSAPCKGRRLIAHSLKSSMMMQSVLVLA